MKLKELIQELKKLEEVHGDLDIVTEGCDCDGDVGEVTLIENRGVYNHMSGRTELGPCAHYVYLARTR